MKQDVLLGPGNITRVTTPKHAKDTAGVRTHVADIFTTHCCRFLLLLSVCILPHTYPPAFFASMHTYIHTHTYIYTPALGSAQAPQAAASKLEVPKVQVSPNQLPTGYIHCLMRQLVCGWQFRFTASWLAACPVLSIILTLNTLLLL